MVGIKGKRQLVISTPKLNEVIPELPEPFTPPVSPRQQPGKEWKKRVSLMVPRSVRQAVKRVLRSIRLMDRHLDEWEVRLLNQKQKSVRQNRMSQR
jgi:hypothetical protein